MDTVAPVLGLLTVVVFLIVARLLIRRRTAAEWTWVTATVARIDQKENLNLPPIYKTFLSSYKTVYIVVATWRDPSTHQSWTFYSGPLSDRPEHYQPGNAIQVYVDLRNPDHYRMPIEGQGVFANLC
jgi:hypothetical protein